MTSGSGAATGGAADLHTHTTASDGLRTPSELVAEAVAAGLAAIAVTDHDTVGGVADAVAGAPPGLRVIPGIELSATMDGAQPHILGYLVDPENDLLAATLAGFRSQRVERVRRFADRLTGLGVPVTFEEVLAEAAGGSVGRPHIARVMIRRGHVATVGEAFDRYLAAGRPGYVEKDEVTAAACIQLIRAAGGVAVLAHPLSTGDPERFAVGLKAIGLVGLEVEYGAYDEDQRAGLRDIAARHGLIPTGGSDYHGPAHRENNRLGDGTVPLSTVAALTALAGR